MYIKGRNLNITGKAMVSTGFVIDSETMIIIFVSDVFRKSRALTNSEYVLHNFKVEFM